MIGADTADNLLVFQLLVKKALPGIFSRLFRCVPFEHFATDVSTEGGFAGSYLKSFEAPNEGHCGQAGGAAV